MALRKVNEKSTMIKGLLHSYQPIILVLLISTFVVSLVPMVLSALARRLEREEEREEEKEEPVAIDVSRRRC